MIFSVYLYKDVKAWGTSLLGEGRTLLKQSVTERGGVPVIIRTRSINQFVEAFNKFVSIFP